jgi:hypothetical protein
MHGLRSDADVSFEQELLGHTSLETTQVSTRVRSPAVSPSAVTTAEDVLAALEAETEDEDNGFRE